MYTDYQEIQRKVVERYISGGVSSDRIRQIIASSFPYITWGNFDIEARYYLPGEDTPAERHIIPVYLPETY
jgi:hypothetical protein